MSNVLNRTTKVFLESVNTPDYAPADWIVNPDMSGVSGVPVERWVIEGDTVRAMTTAEADAALLVTKAVQKGIELERQLVLLMAVRYAPHRQELLILLYNEALAKNWINRASYIKAGLDWMFQCLDLFYVKEAELTVCTTLTQVEAVTWSFAGLIASDPEVTVKGALDLDGESSSSSSSSSV
jgi:hypothetical protein